MFLLSWSSNPSHNPTPTMYQHHSAAPGCEQTQSSRCQRRKTSSCTDHCCKSRSYNDSKRSSHYHARTAHRSLRLCICIHCKYRRLDTFRHFCSCVEIVCNRTTRPRLVGSSHSRARTSKEELGHVHVVRVLHVASLAAHA